MSVSTVVRLAPESTFAWTLTSPGFPRTITGSITPMIFRRGVLAGFCGGGGSTPWRGMVSTFMVFPL